MATLTVNSFTRAGQQVDGGAACTAGGDVFPNTGVEFIAFKNGSGAGVTINFTPTATFDGLTIPVKAVTVPAGQTWFIGPFPPTWYNNGSGQVAITYSAVTTCTIRVLSGLLRS